MRKNERQELEARRRVPRSSMVFFPPALKHVSTVCQAIGNRDSDGEDVRRLIFFFVVQTMKFGQLW